MTKAKEIEVDGENSSRRKRGLIVQQKRGRISTSPVTERRSDEIAPSRVDEEAGNHGLFIVGSAPGVSDTNLAFLSLEKSPTLGTPHINLRWLRDDLLALALSSRPSGRTPLQSVIDRTCPMSM